MVFCLHITVKIKAECVAEFKERWGKLAEHCREHEPETLSYELCASDQADNEFMIVEVSERAPATRLAPRLSLSLTHTSFTRNAFLFFFSTRPRPTHLARFRRARWFPPSPRGEGLTFLLAKTSSPYSTPHPLCADNINPFISSSHSLFSSLPRGKIHHPCHVIKQRYPSRAELEAPHQTSAPFLEFKEWWTTSGVVLEKTGFSSTETGIGYMAKEERLPRFASG
jgi:hypothetical protein